MPWSLAPRIAAVPRREPRRGYPAAYGVIMAGGRGTRFWPLGRINRPKQLLPLHGRRSLLQRTAQRLAPIVGWQHLVVVTAAAHASEVRRQLPRLPKGNVLAEPAGRGTAACLALAAEWIRARGGSDAALMIATPADHAIRDRRGFRRTLAVAAQVARTKECLVTIGIPPTGPETGFGYIETGAPLALEPQDGVHWVRRFREKPSLAEARRLVRSGRVLWNSGLFVWRIGVFLAAVERTLPRLARALAGVWRPAGGSPARVRAAYAGLADVSVDTGVLQPLSLEPRATPRIAVVPAGFDWSDVGTWAALGEFESRDTHGNAVVGSLVAIDAEACTVHAPGRVVALVGVRDLVVVEHAGAILVCPRDRVQDVRRVPAELERRGWKKHL